jgi:riboflavin synthase
MFTGIITEVGTIRQVLQTGGGLRLSVHAAESCKEITVSDSIAVNGVCLTVISLGQDVFQVDVVEETLAKTTLGKLQAAARVNLEPSLRMGDRLGGHMVLGHIDSVGTIRSMERRESSWLFDLEIEPEFGKYIIPVGSVAVDGVSLTVARRDQEVITVSIVPHTMENTLFGEYATGREVNMEFDLLGKYVEQLLLNRTGGVSRTQLREWGYEGI